MKHRGFSERVAPEDRALPVSFCLWGLRFPRFLTIEYLKRYAGGLVTSTIERLYIALIRSCFDGADDISVSFTVWRFLYLWY